MKRKVFMMVFIVILMMTLFGITASAKDAVMLMYDGNKIGYIAKKDNTPFIICLRLNRKIYGVITDIITEQISTKYEFETWFDS